MKTLTWIVSMSWKTISTIYACWELHVILKICFGGFIYYFTLWYVAYLILFVKWADAGKAKHWFIPTMVWATWPVALKLSMWLPVVCIEGWCTSPLPGSAGAVKRWFWLLCCCSCVVVYVLVKRNHHEQSKGISRFFVLPNVVGIMLLLRVTRNPRHCEFLLRCWSLATMPEWIKQHCMMMWQNVPWHMWCPRAFVSLPNWRKPKTYCLSVSQCAQVMNLIQECSGDDTKGAITSWWSEVTMLVEAQSCPPHRGQRCFICGVAGLLFLSSLDLSPWSIFCDGYHEHREWGLLEDNSFIAL